MPLDIVRIRLRNQRLSGGVFTTPEDIVSWLGAVQAQDYPGAKWALALRMRRGADAAIERAFTAGTILRTHVLRPTWHFVTPADIRWMLALTGPRVSAAMAPYNRRLELDAAVFRRSNKTIARALRDGAQLTRQELKTVLERAGVVAGIGVAGVQRLAHLTMQAELDAVICSGARRGKQFTYALFDERVPASRALHRDEALAELTRRYFVSRGPAQVHDFAWWSGLPVADVRAGLAMVGSDLAQEVIDGKTYWFSSSVRALARAPRTAYLLPLYDEFLIAYKDRSAAIDRVLWKWAARPDAFASVVVIDGRAVGMWKQTVVKDRLAIALSPFKPLGRADARAVADAASRYAGFLGLDLVLSR